MWMGPIPKISRGSIKLVMQSLLNELIRHRLLLQCNAAQQAESLALANACIITHGKSVSVYTDSHSAFGVVLDF